jgi:hypothetical protein
MSGIARRRRHSVTFHNPEKAYKGYTYFAPFWEQSRAFLIDMEGRFVNYWQLPGRAGEITFMLENGNILYPSRVSQGEESPLFPGFCGGDTIEVDWDNNIVWKHTDDRQHHTIQRLKNGNTMLLRVIETPKEIAEKVTGGKYGTEDRGTMWSCQLREVTPEGKTAWEWNAHEHLDPEVFSFCPLEHRSEWTHGNSIEELEDGNILTCFRYPSVAVIIDKKSGELIWHWGAGEVFHPHNPTMLDNGNVLIFDNGVHRHDSYLDYSRCVEVNPKTNEIVWEYKGSPLNEFYSSVSASCQRLPNGNTLICEATKGRIFEVTYEKELVWEYMVPFYAPGLSGWAGFNLGRNNYTHRAYRYGPDFEGFKGKDLSPDKFPALNDIYGPDAFNYQEVTI